MIRTARVPFLQSTASAPTLTLTVVVMLAGLAIPFTPLGAAIGLTWL